MDRVTRPDERMAALLKPALEPITVFQIGGYDGLVLCAGFEDRALAVLENALSRSSNFKVVIIVYKPFIDANRLADIRSLCGKAGLKTAEITYDRMNPIGFGGVLLQQLADIRGRVFLDVSAMSRLLIVQSLVALRERGGGFVDCVVAYAEAATYPPNTEEVEEALKRTETDPLSSLLLLSSGVFDVTVVPELSATSVAPSQTRLVAFPSFSPDQLTALRNELAPSRCTFIHGVPPREENKWRTETIAKINRVDLASSDSVRTSTIDYRETLDCLLRLYGEHSERERLLVSPTGSKMQAVAVGLFRAIQDDVQIVYPTPKEFRTHSDYTRGVRQLYSLPFSPFASVMTRVESHS